MAKVKGSTAKGKATTVAKIAKSKGGATRVRRELANQRKAFGAAGAARAAKNWGLTGGKKSAGKGGKAARGGKSAGGGRNG